MTKKSGKVWSKKVNIDPRVIYDTMAVTQIVLNIEEENSMLDHIFSPITISGKEVRNRTAVPAMVMNFCTEDGFCTDQWTSYHEEKAKGGFGMIITENFAVCPQGKGFMRLPGLWKDEQIPGFKEAVDRVHAHGATFVAQIYHAGRQSHRFIIGQAPEAPSAIPCPFSPSPEDYPEELTVERIHEIVGQYGDCARRAKEAGFDGVEIHGGHGYLIAQFTSPYSNKRTDEYGGPLQNRVRFAQEIIQDIRSKCGQDFIVGYRISADEYVTGGRNLQDTLTIIPMLEPLGVSYFNVTAGVYRSFDAVIPSQYTPHAWNVDAAAEAKKVVKTAKIISVGRYNDIRLGETALAMGKCDLVAMGRQSLAEPHTPRLAKEGRFDEIRQCIGCHHACIGHLLQNIPGGCILRPETGREYEIKPLDPVAEPKKVMVIGAGPGGLSAAIEAAKKGHKVQVYERRRWAGGQFRLGSVPAGKGEISAFIVWQQTMCKKYGVELFFNTEVTMDLVKEKNPDVIIAATGATPVIPGKIPGIKGANVVTAHDVLEGKAWTGAKVVVIGGGSVGAETANHLASNLKSVTIVEMMDDIAKDEIVVPRWGLLADLKKNNVTVYTDTKLESINENGVVLSGKYDGQLNADTVVLSMGSRPDNAFAEEVKEAGYDVCVIGDAAKVGLASKAIEEGFFLGREI